ncbi:MAG: hypothetical protein IJ928_01990 [Prevotella sp.]|jgi:negative regulator of sigma E activity|nr:hypothetical protein [Prevotella sp.]
MNEDDKLKERFGNANHFSVPDKFFDNFAEQFMQQLPAQEVQIRHVKPAAWRRLLKPVAVAAGLMLVAALTTTLFWNKDAQEADMNTSDTAYKQSQDYSINQMANYAMLDNEEFYRYLADN